ncbi:MAG: hypothetical protein M3P45_08435 [Acidobacteriota bacterium]|nr:hypothetical protein [Acidobacteriota bacterium]
MSQNEKLNGMKISMAGIRRSPLLTVAALLFHAVTALSVSAQAPDIYITPDGGGSGICTSNTHTPSWFNSAGNWGTGAAQIGPGTIVHLCGTFNGALNTTLLTAQGNGTSGTSVTILFESGTVLQSPAWAGTGTNLGAINISNRQFITVDGGSNGSIKNTANGTNLANRQITSTGINAMYCTGCRVTNLSILDLYVRNSNDATNGVLQTGINAVSIRHSDGMHIDHNVFTNCGWCISGYGNNIEINHNDISKMDHGVAIGPDASGATNEVIHDNHFHDMGQWDTTTNAYHHDGIHLFSDSGPHTNPRIYNNLFDGSLGINTTAWIFMEGASGSFGIHGAIIFNNVLVDSLNAGKTMLWMEGHGSSSNNSAYNNYLYDGHGGGLGLLVRGETNFSAQNNIIGDVSYQSSSVASGGVNNNLYFNLYPTYGNNNLFGWNTSTVASVSSWRTLCSCDANGLFGLPSEIYADPSTGAIVSPSMAIGGGTNLTRLGIPSLNLDKSGNPRPSIGPWDIGAYSASTQPASVAAPTGLHATVN